jgi:hypothetical protein
MSTSPRFAAVEVDLGAIRIVEDDDPAQEWLSTAMADALVGSA